MDSVDATSAMLCVDETRPVRPQCSADERNKELRDGRGEQGWAGNGMGDGLWSSRAITRSAGINGGGGRGWGAPVDRRL